MSAFKVVDIGDAGTAQRYGANDLSKIARILNGDNLNAGIRINNDFKFLDGRLIFRDLSDEHNIKIKSSTETANWNLTIPVLGGNRTIALKDKDNTFSATQTISEDVFTILTLRRPKKDAFTEWALNFNALDSVDAVKTYALIKAGIQVNTAGAEDGYLTFQTIKAGTLVTRFNIANTGNVFIGASGTRAELDVASIASSDKKFTFQNASGTFITTNNVNGTNLALGTSTGTKIGTATNQKIGFWNKDPAVQQSSIAAVDTSTVDGTYGAEEQAVLGDLRTKFDDLVSKLKTIGIIAT